MPGEYQCPNCKSGNIHQQGTNFVCYACGNVEPLYDYPMSWDWNRGLRQLHGLPDPGPNEPCKTIGIDELEARVTYLEGLEEIDPIAAKTHWEEIKQLKAQILYLQKSILNISNKIRGNEIKTTLSKDNYSRKGKDIKLD